MSAPDVQVKAYNFKRLTSAEIPVMFSVDINGLVKIHGCGIKYDESGLAWISLPSLPNARDPETWATPIELPENVTHAFCQAALDGWEIFKNNGYIC